MNEEKKNKDSDLTSGVEDSKKTSFVEEIIDGAKFIYKKAVSIFDLVKDKRGKATKNKISKLCKQLNKVSIISIDIFNRHVLSKKNFLWIKNNKSKSISILILLIGIIFILSVSSSGENSNKMKASSYNNLLRINNIQSELSEIQQKLSQTSQVTESQKSAINNELKGIDSKISKLNNSSDVIRESSANCVTSFL